MLKKYIDQIKEGNEKEKLDEGSTNDDVEDEIVCEEEIGEEGDGDDCESDEEEAVVEAVVPRYSLRSCI